MQGYCSIRGCTELSAAWVEEHAYCRKHFLLRSYERLETVASQMQQRQFDERQADEAGRFLESCMRDAADVACAAVAPSNREKAQMLDVLLWASELHGRLRRSTRRVARIPVQLRSKSPGHPWEERTETTLVSRHGAQVTCGHELAMNEKLTLVRLDKGWETEVRVAWVSHQGPGVLDVGLEFVTDKNFWELGSDASIPRTRETAGESAPTGVRGTGKRFDI